MSSASSNMVILATLNDVSEYHTSDTLNSLTNTELLNLVRQRLVERMRNESLDLADDLNRMLDDL